jgi:outer membrane protein
MGALSSPAAAEPIDLLEAYRLASAHDPQLAAAREQLRADRQQVPLARSLVLPQIGAQGDVSHVWEDTEIGGAPGIGGRADYSTRSLGVGLTQTLFRRDALVALGQARVIMDQADLRFELARQRLALQVAEAYFRVLEAEDTVTSFDAELRAIERQLQRAQRAFELGAGTVTDVHEAQARLDGTRARRIGALNERQVARENLRRTINAPVTQVSGLPAGFEPQMPQPAEAGPWAELAEERNLQVRLALSGLDLAGREIDRQRAGRYPQLDLVANAGRSYQGSLTQVPGGGALEADRASVGLQVTVPLYTGGAVTAQVRQAQAQREVSYHQMLDARRQAALSAESAYLTLVANLEQVRALEQALVSIESNEQATQRGLQVGLRTTLDLLNVQRERYQIERDLAAARYGYLMTYLQLHAAVGEALDERAIEAVNTFLTGRP